MSHSKKVASETTDATGTGFINISTNKSSIGKKDDMPVMKEKMR
jgi:hypothetical protein